MQAFCLYYVYIWYAREKNALFLIIFLLVWHDYCMNYIDKNSINLKNTNKRI